MKIQAFIILLLFFCLTSCKTEKQQNGVDEKTAEMEETTSKGRETGLPLTEAMTKADSLVADAIAAHGGELYDTAYYGFRFRKKQYSFRNSPSGYRFSATEQKDGDNIEGILENGNLTRIVNGDTTELSDKEVAKYTEALNSVIYFATLPHKLQDEAVNRDYVGQTTIAGQKYETVAVTFDQEGGGEDYSDEFRYWINADTKTVDYLAYNYETNDGGVRFRSAYNPRTVGGIRFQDYVNYEAPIGTPLDELPELFEAGKLKELSRIETEKVVELKK
ncbi:MAG: DUF6503 family protein [Pricia sp.]